ncbi:hypothetical protein Cadr_000028264, partial [Camelus dromedarius]
SWEKRRPGRQPQGGDQGSVSTMAWTLPAPLSGTEYEEEERTGDALLSCRATEVRTQSPSPPWSGPLSYSPCLLIAQSFQQSLDCFLKVNRTSWIALGGCTGDRAHVGSESGGEIQMCLIKKDCTEVRPPTPLSETTYRCSVAPELDTA